MTTEEFSEVDASQLIHDVEEYGKYAFLIGAGTSKQAGIPTTGELISEWQEERHGQAETDKGLTEWVQHVESEEKSNSQSEYGFWFEQCHPKEVHRRQYIQELVDDTDPTLHHLILARMMSEGYVPHVLTPNFDDLLFDAFYSYLEDKPNVLAHQALAPEFKLTHDDSTIVKLHGDYLYNNLKNTDSETKTLEPAMRDVVEQTVNEYGLIVVGYSGGDKSIMEPLLEAELSKYGIYWCTRSTDDIEPEVKELLERPNVDLVEIEGFGSLMARLEEEIPDLELPPPNEIVERAEVRAEELRGTVAEPDKEATDEEEELRERTAKRWEAIEAYENGNYSQALDAITDIIDDNPDDAGAYNLRGATKTELDRHDEAIEDYTQAIELDPASAPAYTNRGNVKSELGKYEEAIADHTRAIEINPESVLGLQNRAEARVILGEYESALDDARKAKSHIRSVDKKATSLLLEIIANILRGEEVTSAKEVYQNLCDDEFTTDWYFGHLDSWLEETSFEPEKREQIEEVIELLREHKSEA